MEKKHLKIQSIRINVLLNIAYTFMGVAFPLITYPYVSRILSPVGIGRVNFFSQISSYCVLLANLGISTYGIRSVARSRLSDELLSRTVTDLFNINWIATVIIEIIYFIVAIFSSQFRNNIPLVTINSLVILATPFSLDWMYSGLEQYTYITQRDFIFRLISVFLIFIFVRHSSDYVSYALILAFTSIGTSIINFIFANKITKIRFSLHNSFRKHIKPMLALFGSTLAVSVYTGLDTIMLGFISGDRQVGLYTTATKIETILLSLINAISLALLPRLSLYIKEKNYNEFNKILKRTISFIITITLPITSFFIITSKECLIILGGNKFADATLSMQLLMPILIISGISNITGNQILIPQGEDKQFMKAVVIGSFVDIIFNIILIPKFSAAGASLSTLIAELLQMSMQLFYAKKEIVRNINWKNIFKSIICSLCASILLIQLQKIVTNGIMIKTIIESMLYFALYIALLILIREENILQIVWELKQRLRNDRK